MLLRCASIMFLLLSINHVLCKMMGGSDLIIIEYIVYYHCQFCVYGSVWKICSLVTAFWLSYCSFHFVTWFGPLVDTIRLNRDILTSEKAQSIMSISSCIFGWSVHTTVTSIILCMVCCVHWKHHIIFNIVVCYFNTSNNTEGCKLYTSF